MLTIERATPADAAVYAKLGYRHFGRSVYPDGRPLLLLDKDL